MKKLEVNQMENLEGGKCSTWAGGFCAATIILTGSGIFAPLAGATGFGCVLGLMCND